MSEFSTEDERWLSEQAGGGAWQAMWTPSEARGLLIRRQSWGEVPHRADAHADDIKCRGCPDVIDHFVMLGGPRKSWFERWLLRRAHNARLRHVRRNVPQSVRPRS